MKSDNKDKDEGVADVDDDDNYDDINKNVCYLHVQVNAAGNYSSCVSRGSAY
jgi:hypothetical protein